MELTEPSLWLFFGRLHPLVLHFPVALLIIAGVLELLPKIKKINTQTGYHSAILVILIFGALSAIMAVSMGLSLVSSGGYQGETIYWHKRFGLSVAVLGTLAACFKYLVYKKYKQSYFYPYLVSLTLCIGAIFVAGHYGGVLTHGSEFLPSAAPEPLASWLREDQSHKPKRHQNNDVFTISIEPILEEHCFQCHGENKQQGELQLNAQNKAFTGGESGNASIKAGSALQSEIIRRLFLPRDNKKAMPPEDRSRPSANELVTLMDWIESGAPWAGESSGPSEFLADYLAQHAKPAAQEHLNILQDAGANVQRINKNNPLLTVNMSLVNFTNQQLLSLLTPLKNNIAWLNLANNTVDEPVIELLGQFSYLTRLSLANTQLTNDLIGHIVALENLTSLNITGNQIHLKSITNLLNSHTLETLYLWKTQVSSEQIKALKIQYPNVKLVSASLMKKVTQTIQKRDLIPPPEKLTKPENINTGENL